MTYTPTTWVDNITPVDATRMNNIEDGISNALENASPVQIGTALNLDTRPKQLQLSQEYESESTALFSQHIEARVRGTSTAGPAKPFFGSITTIQDHSSVGNWSISNAANNGSGLIRITCATHTITTGDSVGVYGVGGTTEANGQWIATVISSTQVDLQGSTFANSYTSGGTITNRGSFYGHFFSLQPSATRGGLTGTAAFGDDVNGVGVFNGGSVKCLSAYLVNRNSAFGSAQEFDGCFTAEANARAIVAAIGDYELGLDLYGFGLASYSSAAILLPNNVKVNAVNAAASGHVELFNCNTLNEFQVFAPSRFSATVTVDASVTMGNSHNIALGTSTGSKIGTGTTQKLGFWNATPVVQPTNIADADGTLADITTKFNSLLTKLETIGLLAA